MSKGGWQCLPCCLNGSNAVSSRELPDPAKTPHGFLQRGRRAKQNAGEWRLQGIFSMGRFQQLQWQPDPWHNSSFGKGWLFSTRRKALPPSKFKAGIQKILEHCNFQRFHCAMKQRKAKPGMSPKCFNKTGYFRIRRKAGKGKPDAALG